jgi:hypothetical protein
MACSSGCPTQDHVSWGECVRSKNLKTNALNPEVLSVQRKADKTLDAYQAARKQGIQPKSTRAHHVKQAIRASDKAGKAFKAE